MDPMTLVAIGTRAGVAVAVTNAVVTLTREFIAPAFITAWNWIVSWGSTIPQCVLIEGIPENGGTIYRKQVVRRTMKPYKFKYSHPTQTITGIACLPLDEKTQSPEAEVLEGGIHHTFAVICLTPVQEGDWACSVTICGAPETAHPSTKTSSEVSLFGSPSDGHDPFQQMFRVPALLPP